METWTTTQVKDFLHLGSTAAARLRLRRWGVTQATDPDGRALHDATTGEKLWPADVVKDRQGSRPRPHYRRGVKVDHRVEPDAG